MKVPVLIAIILFFLSINTQAKLVTKENATKVAESFFKIQSEKPTCNISDVYIESINNINTFYVFSFSPMGFVIVSADDNIEPILGYSITGLFDKNNVPPQLKGWLQEYSKGIYDVITLKQNNLSESKIWEQILSGKYQSAKSLVTPLCTTLWDQSCYYNELCPADTLGPCDHAVTGCVATAMAQIMKFWNYPSKGQGSHTYHSFWYGNLSADFGATTYDWGSMPNVVTSANPAVATLMYQCGVSVDMDYYATSSSSNNYFARTALPNYFKYSNNIEFVYKLNYTDSLWIELMKSELNAGRPVLYQGRPDSTWMPGHSWVCDGYDSNNFLHFNWGWGPGNEGYYEMGNYIYRKFNEALIKIMPVVSCDIALRNFVLPVPATFSAPSTIKVRVANFDTLSHNNIPISYVVDGGTPVNEIIISPLAALSDTIYEFTQPFDFSPNPGHVYNVKVYSSLSCDGYKANDTLSIPIENVACVNPPYSMGFEPSENMNGWVMIDVDSDGNKWNIGTGGNTQPACVYYNGGTSQGNDWLITKCQQLDANKVYKLSYYYKGTSQYWPNKLNVSIGNQQDIANMTTLLFSDTNIINTNYLKKEIYFTVPASGSYYIGWYCFSNPDNYSLVLDDINISEQIALNVGIVSTNLPNESCNLQQENIEVVIKNYCSTVLNNFPVSYSLNGGTPVTENVITAIPAGGTLAFTFSTPIDLSANGIYNVKIFTSLPNDTIINNDTLNITVINHISITPTYTMEFEPTNDFSGWKIYNNNNDFYNWSIQTTGGRTLPYCIRYDYSYSIPADDWFVSSCISLSSSQSYRLRFWYKIESDQWPEKLNVFIGNGQDITDLTTLLLDFPNMINMTYQESVNIFTVPADGLYYIGWHCYSDVLMFNLYIDDISIDFATTNNNNLYNTDYLLYPNPCKNEITIEHSEINKEEIKYEISTSSGKQITQVISRNNKVTISTKDLSKGIYILKMISNKGIVVKKLVKQ